ncbi:MAG: ATP-binding protein [Clostridiales bacterium]|nr:ATP-binding protein [Clostridiales bacterium]
MGFSIAYIKELYEKAYKEGVKASETRHFAVAKKKLYEAAVYAKKLAQMDPANSDMYERRAEKLKGISDSIDVEALEPAPYTAQTPQTSSGYSRGGNQAGQQLDSQSGAGEDMSSFYTFFEASELTDGFESVIGLEEAKEAVTEYVINPIKYPDAYNYNFISSKCILLEGPPGTGKTTFAKAVAKEIEQPFALVNVASLVNCYVGETGKTIDKVFNSLRDYVERNNCGLTVFFDEFDEIAKSRGGDDKASQTAVPALLRNLDGVKENKNFLILANTNCRDSLDAGILSRFRRKIFIPLPDANMRKQFFTNKLKQLEPEYFEQLDMEQLAEASEGLSGRTITQICDDYLHFIGGVKAGLRSCDDFNAALIKILINNQ